jgi:hypothetical protein
MEKCPTIPAYHEASNSGVLNAYLSVPRIILHNKNIKCD